MKCLICDLEGELNEDLFEGGYQQLYCGECLVKRKNAWGICQVAVPGSRIYVGDLEAARIFKGGRLAVYCDPPDYDGPRAHIPILESRPKSPTDRTAKANMEAILDCLELIHEHHKTGAPLLVHCHGGIERSPLVLACYLVDSNRSANMKEAYAYLKSIRPAVADRSSWL